MTFDSNGTKGDSVQGCSLLQNPILVAKGRLSGTVSEQWSEGLDTLAMSSCISNQTLVASTRKNGNACCSGGGEGAQKTVAEVIR